MEMIQLVNGVQMPILGFGTFKIEDLTIAEQSVHDAIVCGYRHIDCASVYGNEKAVGEGVKTGLAATGLSREQLFIVSKVWNADQGYEQTLQAFAQTCSDLGVDYLDLYLIHWPAHDIELTKGTWKAMEELYRLGKVRAIGVCNFMKHHIQELLSFAEILPMVNQVELHPQFPEKYLRAFCEQHQIAITAWGPLMQGKIFESEILYKIAQKHQRSISQVALRWHIQQNIIAIPKSIHVERMQDNLKIFDFELDAEDMRAIDQLNTGRRLGPDPDERTF